MTLSEELHEASVAATGHHADLLRRAAEYVAACEGQEAVARIIKNSAGQISIFGADGYGFDVSKYIGSDLYLHPSPPPAGMQLVPVELTDEIADELWKTSGTFTTRELWANALKAARGES